MTYALATDSQTGKVYVMQESTDMPGLWVVLVHCHNLTVAIRFKNAMEKAEQELRKKAKGGLLPHEQS